MKKIKKHRKHLTITTLEHGYCDPREMLLHASFQILENFVKEPMFKKIDWTWNEYHQNVYNESMFLLDWWRRVRPQREKKDPLFAPGVKCPKKFDFVPVKDSKFFERGPSDLTQEEDAVYTKACVDHEQFELDCDKEDDDMLKRLIDIRQGLWT